MKNNLTLAWLKAAGIRALKTVAQTALGMLTIGATIAQVDWFTVLSASFVAGVYSILTSFATSLPEVNTATDGTLHINTTDDVVDKYLLDITTDLGAVAEKKTLTLTVDSKTPISQ